MDKKEYLDEKKYKKASNVLFFIGIGLVVVALVAILAAVVLMIFGNGSTADQESALNQRLEQLRPGLEERYAELEAMGVRESTDYKDKDGFEMEQIDIALNPRYEYCAQTTAYVKNTTTQEYCEIKEQIYNIHNLSSNPGIAWGGALFIALPCFGFGLVLIMMAKRRSIMAYTMQQSMPVAQETTEKMTPTVAKAAGHVAKEVARGIKEGKADEPTSESKPEEPKE